MSSDQQRWNGDDLFDLVIVGGGSAGMPAAISAAEAGGSVLVLEHSAQLGGSLHVANGQMSAAGTRLQAAKGIADTPEEHFADVMRISRGTVDEALVRLAIWNAADTIDWLTDLGFEPDPAAPATGIGHEPYSKARYLWGLDKGHSIRRVLEAQIDRLSSTGRISIRLEHEAKALILGPTGAVTGVVAQGPDGQSTACHARAVLLASGGYNANPDLYREICGRDLYTTLPYAFGRGAGHRLALSAGGYLRGVEKFFCNFGYTLADDALPAPLAGRAVTYPERRAPWEIYVNAMGHRFVREDMASIDARENALMAQPGERYWIVFDQAILDTAPPLMLGWTREDMAAAFSNQPFFYKADTLDGLASAMGLDSAQLATTVAGYNYGVATGSDFLGRQHLPRPIETAPYYGIRQQGAPVSSAAGVAVNADLQVIRPDGSAIGGLFAAGEILGSGQLMGRATVGGMMVTPALTFGRLLGRRLVANA
ncbi:MAG: FAD-binding protein [Phenylobacterium sp.]|nr:FAD-binding protein [Phenylobacterium sp.]